MTVTRSLLILLSFLLCCTVLAQRADHNLEETNELSSLIDIHSGHTVEIASDCDINDAGLLPGVISGGYIPRIKECASLNKFYRQLVISPPRRPPVA
jgi:hypothetical protein